MTRWKQKQQRPTTASEFSHKTFAHCWCRVDNWLGHKRRQINTT